MFFCKHSSIVHKSATSTYGYQFGINPSYVYLRCDHGHISGYSPESVRASSAIRWKCSDCGVDDRVIPQGCDQVIPQLVR